MSLKNAKALVTGADGFIGSHLVEGLIGQGVKNLQVAKITLQRETPLYQIIDEPNHH